MALAKPRSTKSFAVRPAFDPKSSIEVRNNAKLLERLAGGLGFEPRLAESESAFARHFIYFYQCFTIVMSQKSLLLSHSADEPRLEPPHRVLVLVRRRE